MTCAEQIKEVKEIESSKIFNVNSGVCQSRVQLKDPKPYFINWQQNGKNKYKFFRFPFELHKWECWLKRLADGEKVSYFSL